LLLFSITCAWVTRANLLLGHLRQVDLEVREVCELLFLAEQVEDEGVVATAQTDDLAAD